MRVLVTRPQPGADRTAARLEAMGHDTVKLPLFESRVTATPGDLPDATEIDGILATSARAFSMFGSAGVPHAYRRLPVYAVGPATAEAARNAGFSKVYEGAGSARDLAARVTGDGIETGVVAGAEIGRLMRPLYLAGQPRRAVIEEALDAARMRHTVLECYRMDEISYATDYFKTRVLTLPIDAVLFYSANAAMRFSGLMTAQMPGEAMDSARFGCMSAEVAAALPIAWRRRAFVAAHPDEASLLASLGQLG